MVGKIYFVGGANGSGKTAMVNELRKILADTVEVHDFDDIGVPIDADKAWRQKTTEHWLQRLLSDGRDTCLLGQMVLGEILACPSAHRLGSVNFCLLDVCDTERIKRLKVRGTQDARQETLNWASWLRMHHQDPTWAQHVITENSWDGLCFDVWTHCQSWHSRAKVHVMDTTGKSLRFVAHALAGLIKGAFFMDAATQTT